MTIAIACHCPRCDFWTVVHVPPDAIGTHGCARCNGLMQVFLARGSREAIEWHRADRKPCTWHGESQP